MSKVLILGAGLVAKPIVNYLLDRGIDLTVCDYLKENADAVIMNRKGAVSLAFDVNDDNGLDSLVKSHDLVVSLLPFKYHPKVAKSAIRFKKNMLTASYVSPEMKALDNEAKKSGIIILNELGLDPGLDHMSAMKIIDEVHGRGGQIEEFYSYCGALAAPEYTNNPLRYKFTWSPRGVIMASGNSARYKLNGHIIDVAGKDLFKDIRKFSYPGLGELEVYPNRDSIPYMDIYGIQESKTVLRGTIRFPGWCEIMGAVNTLGLLSTDDIDASNKSCADLISGKLGKAKPENVREDLAEYYKVPSDSLSIKGFDWLGLFDNTIIGKNRTSLFDILAEKMLARMMLGKDEKDMVLMIHTFHVTDDSGEKQFITSKLLDYGSPATDTAIARTVALPAAIGVKLILENKIKLKGVHIPVLPEIYIPVLAELEKLGIKMDEEYKSC